MSDKDIKEKQETAQDKADAQNAADEKAKVAKSEKAHEAIAKARQAKGDADANAVEAGAALEAALIEAGEVDVANALVSLQGGDVSIEGKHYKSVKGIVQVPSASVELLVVTHGFKPV